MGETDDFELDFFDLGSPLMLSSSWRLDAGVRNHVHKPDPGANNPVLGGMYNWDQLGVYP